jgi:hypothetical protein
MQATHHLIFTHNNRIQCLLNTFKTWHIGQRGGFNEEVTQKSKQDIYKDEEKIRFKNCAVIKISVSPNQLNSETNTVNVEMIYEGELSDHEQSKLSSGKKKYYIKEEKEEVLHPLWVRIFMPREYVIPLLNLNIVQVLPFTVYLVRHGQGVHNANNWLMRPVKGVYDTPLTMLGKEQATRAAHELIKNLNNEASLPKGGRPNRYTAMRKLPELPVVMFGISDLYRTYQTCLSFAGVFTLNFNVNIYLLPCSHEISSGKANCDTIKSKFYQWSPENQTTLDYAEVQNAQTDKVFNVPKTAEVQNAQTDNVPKTDAFNVRKYKTLYKNGVRGTNDTTCYDENMIQLAFDIQTELYPNPDDITDDDWMRWRHSFYDEKKDNRKNLTLYKKWYQNSKYNTTGVTFDKSSKGYQKWKKLNGISEPDPQPAGGRSKRRKRTRKNRRTRRH